MRVRGIRLTPLFLFVVWMGGIVSADEPHPYVTVEIPAPTDARAVLNRPGYILARPRLLPFLPVEIPLAARLPVLLARGVQDSDPPMQIRYRVFLQGGRLREALEVSSLDADADGVWAGPLPGVRPGLLREPLSGTGVRFRLHPAAFQPHAMPLEARPPLPPLVVSLHPQGNGVRVVVEMEGRGDGDGAGTADGGAGAWGVVWGDGRVVGAGRSVLRLDLDRLPLPVKGREAFLLETLGRVAPGMAGEVRGTLHWLRQYTGVRVEGILARVEGVLAGDLWVDGGMRWRVTVPVRDAEGLGGDVARALQWWDTLDPDVHVALTEDEDGALWAVSWGRVSGVVAVRGGKLVLASDGEAMAVPGADVDLRPDEVGVWRIDPVAGWSMLVPWARLAPLMGLGAEGGAVLRAGEVGRWRMVLEGANAPLNTLAVGMAAWETGVEAFPVRGREETYAVHWLRYLASLRQAYVRLGLDAWNTPGVVPPVTSMPMQRGETGETLAGWVGRVYDPSGRWSVVALRHLERMAAGEAVFGHGYREPTHVGGVPYGEAGTWAYVAVPVGAGVAFVVYADGSVYRWTGATLNEAALLRLPERRDAGGWVEE